MLDLRLSLILLLTQSKCLRCRLFSLEKSLLEITLKPTSKTIISFFFFSIYVKWQSNSYLFRQCATILLAIVELLFNNFEMKLSPKGTQNWNMLFLLLMRIQYSVLWINFNQAFITSDNRTFALKRTAFSFKKKGLHIPPSHDRLFDSCFFSCLFLSLRQRKYKGEKQHDNIDLKMYTILPLIQ